MRPWLHLLAEIEVVFGLWAALFLIIYSCWEKPQSAIKYMESLNFTEPLFIFVIMIVAATRPILFAARDFFVYLSAALQKVFGMSMVVADIFILLTMGPLTGSFMTEPAAMTVTALLLRSLFKMPIQKLIYFLIAVLFVNVSIGGALTPYAAPPLLMVAKAWGWDFAYVFQHFGVKTIVALVLNAALFVFIFRKDLQQGTHSLKSVAQAQQLQQGLIPWSMTAIHFLFLILIVLNAHNKNTFMGIFLFFLAVTTVTSKHQDRLRFRESLLVAFFLGGIIVFGAFQKWWLTPLLTQLSESALFFGSVCLTAITDNAALTYLGSQVEGLAHSSRYALVAGALVGGGLTVIANAPNVTGLALLSDQLPDKVLNPWKLFKAALVPTLIALACFWLLPF